SNATFALTPMTPAELEDAVSRPAERAGVRFEPGLVTTIVGETVSRPGALPLLPFTLFELYEQQGGPTISVDAYRELGGVGGALARRAEHIYASMKPDQQAQVRSLFMQLVVPGEDGDDLRRRVGRDDLAKVDAEVVEAYRANRLLVSDYHPI